MVFYLIINRLKNSKNPNRRVQIRKVKLKQIFNKIKMRNHKKILEKLNSKMKIMKDKKN